MYLLLSVSMAILPAAYLVYYFYKKDVNQPEPRKVILKIFFIGVLSTIPTIVIELLFDKAGSLVNMTPVEFYLFDAFVIAAFTEEVMKLLVVLFFVYKKKNFDEIMDGIVYGVTASLGFACAENVLYTIGGGIETAILRAFTSVPLHALATGIMGYYVGRAKFSGSSSSEKRYIIFGLLIAIAIHGLYDFVLFAIPVFGALPALGIIPLLILSYMFLRGRMKFALKEDLSSGRVRKYL